MHPPLNRSAGHLAIAAIFAVSSFGFALRASAADATSPPPSPVLGKSLRYCNPLPLVASSTNGSAQGVSLGDVTVMREQDKYYMYCSGGAAWVSSDLVNWEYHRVIGQPVPVAPTVAKYNGAFYMCGNNDNGGALFRAPDPLGPYSNIGDWKKTGDASTGWKNAFDMDIFVDDDNKPYLLFSGRSTAGVFIAPLDPSDLTTFAALPKNLFAFNSSHLWERYGEMNEYPDVSWIEGPWMFKRDGTYYVEYSASGTQWLTYATGVYSAKSPLGPFAYSPTNPVLRKTTGVVTGPAHGSAVQGPDGNWWQFYTIVLANPPGGRRIGMDPIGFDKDGNMFVRGPTETPQWGPGVVPDPARDGDSGSIPLTVNKLRAMNAQSRFSSERPGHEAAYAIDNNNGTWWEPATNDEQPSLTLDLSPATRFDPVQSFTVDSCRIEFTTGGGGFGGRRGGRGATGGDAAPPSTSAGSNSVAHQYKVEVSNDGTNYTTVLDKTANTVTKYTEFEEIPPTACRFVRFTVTGWPHIGNAPLGIMEFTVFGKPILQAKN